MKVLHVLNELNPSGAEVMLEIAAESFKINNIETYILSTGKTMGPYEMNLQHAGYKTFHIPLRPLKRFIIEFYKFLKQYHFDVVHIHSEGASLYVSTVTRLFRKVKPIRTVHHIWPYQTILPFIRRYIFRFIVNRVYHVKSISNSITGRKNEMKYYHIKNELIPNWYNDKKYIPITFEEKEKRRKAYGISDDVTVFASLGKNWPYKNFDLILEAFSELSIHNIKYLQIGPDFKEKSLITKANKLQLSKEQVELLGKVDEPLSYLYLADVFILPSSNEGFGNAVLEAIGCGLPVILSDVPALFDYKNYFKDVYWINPTKSDIKKAVKHFKKFDRRSLFRMGQVNASLAQKNFGIQVGAKAYIDMYDSL